MIQLKNISFSYANKKEEQQLKDVDLNINEGEFLLLCGKSGCGKTSILRLVNGLIPNYYEGELSGEILINGENLEGKKIYEISRRVSTVFQNPKSQFFNLDTTSEIVFPLENRGISKDVIEQKLREVEKVLDISDLLDKNIFHLSGGEKQKLAIASAYAADTDIILFDEPTSNLDMKSIEDIRKMLGTLKDMGKTIIISEHRLYFLNDLIDRAVYIEDGKIQNTFSKEEFNNLSEEKRIDLGLRTIDLKELGVNANQKKECRKNLEIRNIEFKYRGSDAFKVKLENATFDFGSIVGIIGKNGQGKTTFANALTGLEKRVKSEVVIKNEKFNEKKRLEKSYLVMQNVGYQLFTESVEEELKLSLHKKRKEVDLENVLKSLNIEQMKEMHPLSLSGGQQQRVSIGACICAGSEIMFFDEPTSGMDYYHMVEIAKAIKDTSNENNIIFVVSHDLEFLLSAVDTIAVFKNGTINETFKLEFGSVNKIVDALI